jgi:hypothetical protein
MKGILATAFGIFAIAATAPTPQAGSTPVEIKPTAYSKYWVSTGRVEYGSQGGWVFKNGRDSDVTTLVTFEIPAQYAGRKCEFGLTVDGPEGILGGTQTVDLFSSLAPATEHAPTWPNGNLRDQNVGRMKVDSYSKQGSYLDGFPNKAKSFPCVAGTIAGEMVGTGNQDELYWTTLSKGAYIKVYNEAAV